MDPYEQEELDLTTESFQWDLPIYDTDDLTEMVDSEELASQRRLETR